MYEIGHFRFLDFQKFISQNENQVGVRGNIAQTWEVVPEHFFISRTQIAFESDSKNIQEVGAAGVKFTLLLHHQWRTFLKIQNQRYKFVKEVLQRISHTTTLALKSSLGLRSVPNKPTRIFPCRNPTIHRRVFPGNRHTRNSPAYCRPVGKSQAGDNCVIKKINQSKKYIFRETVSNQ